MLSRVAENLFWMSRYFERADNLARLVTVHQTDLLDATSAMAEDSYDWHPLLAVTSMGDENSTESVQDYMVRSQENPDSITNCIYQARENGRAVRDQISDEMWIELNALWLDLKAILKNGPGQHEKICQMVNRSSLVFRGIVNVAQPRAEAWAFIQLGEYLERADKTSRVIDLPNYLRGRDEASAWSTMLRACSAAAEHRRHYSGEADSTSASTLLLFSTSFPRSVRFCVQKIDDLLHQISGTDSSGYLNEAERASGSLLARMNFSGVEEISSLGLHDYVDSVQFNLNEIGAAIGFRYFALTKESPSSSAEEFFKIRMRSIQKQQ
ncbi:MAG: alpha-E domain-containing protein [Verrucomicrobiales bacterium]|nr:alpha-E domain-containing protein [Verrucomicrobiales bacterium]